MIDEVKTKVAMVQSGDNMLTFIERHGIDIETLVKHNADRLRTAAEARGFAHGFIRETAGEGNQVVRSQEYHVFPGEELLVPDTATTGDHQSNDHWDGGPNKSHVEG